MLPIRRLERIYTALLTDGVRGRIEKIILSIAIISFIAHLAIIYLVSFEVVDFTSKSDLLNNPIAAIYTPFSFILLYEVYLLIFYLPRSFTTYIGKQYEIITLIIIRRIFKDLSNLDLQGDWFRVKYDLQFTYDLITAIVIFALLFVFYKQSKTEQAPRIEPEGGSNALRKFVRIKKRIALLLMPIFIVLSIYSFTAWAMGVFQPTDSYTSSFNNINNIFFEQFFNVLIFADVLVLLFSFFITDEFYKVIRNSGFIISTILIRISFSTTGLTNNVFIISAIVFGLLVLFIHNKFRTIAT
jgi:hypothetical protein